MKHKKAERPLKPRGVWSINPKTRVKPSEKIYNRPKEKKEARKNLLNGIDWFGIGK